MKFTQKALSLLGTAALFAGLAANALAQQAAPPKDDDQRSRLGANETTMTGCLTKDSSGAYTLANETSGVKTTVTGSADLEKHSANHKVTLTGSMKTDSAGKSVFEATKIEHVSDSCGSATK